MYYIVFPNSFAYNPARINVVSIGYQNTSKNVIVSSLYEVFKTSDDVDDRLLWHWFKSPDFQKLIEPAFVFNSTTISSVWVKYFRQLLRNNIKSELSSTISTSLSLFISVSIEVLQDSKTGSYSTYEKSPCREHKAFCRGSLHRVLYSIYPFFPPNWGRRWGRLCGIRLTRS
jgi:hypothetical protein